MIFSGSSALKLSNNPDAAIRLLNIPIYPLTYSEHLNLKYGNFENDISNPIIRLIFDGKVEDISFLNRKIIDIYLNLKNFDMGEWKNFLQYGGFPSSFNQDSNDIIELPRP